MKTLSLLLISCFILAPVAWAQTEIERPHAETETRLHAKEEEQIDGLAEDDFVARPIEEIEELFRQQQYQTVIEECKRLLAYDPWRWEAKWARLKLSECYAALGQPDKAETILAEAEASISHPREKAEILLWRLRYTTDKGDFELAHKLAEELATKFIGDHHVLEAMEIIIESDLERGRLEAARQRIDGMLQQYPFQETSFWLAVNLSEHYREHGQRQQAVEVLRRILKIHPDRVEALAQLAETYREMGDSDKTIEACDAAAAAFPAHWQVVHVLSMKGEILKQRGDWQGALKAFLTAGEFRGTNQARWALVQAAECYQHLDEEDKAIELLTRLSQGGYPDNFTVEASGRLAGVYAENFDYNRAEAILKALVETYPQTRHANEAMMRLLEMYWRANQRDKAIDFMIYLLTTAPNPYLRHRAIERLIELSHEEGIVEELEARGKLPELAKGLRQAVEVEASRAPVLAPLRALAVIAQWQENWDEAIEVNTRLIEDYNDLLITLEARERLAECYKAKGEFDKALEQVNYILVIAPDGPRAPSAMLRGAHYQLAQELKQSNALNQLRELAEKFPNSEEGHEAREILERFE